MANLRYAHDLSRIGAARNGGRWNKKGTYVLYTSESREVALLEITVHPPSPLSPYLEFAGT